MYNFFVCKKGGFGYLYNEYLIEELSYYSTNEISKDF